MKPRQYVGVFFYQLFSCQSFPHQTFLHVARPSDILWWLKVSDRYNDNVVMFRINRGKHVALLFKNSETKRAEFEVEHSLDGDMSRLKEIYTNCSDNCIPSV